MLDHKTHNISLPIRPIATTMKVDLLCGADGKAWIIHEKLLPPGLNWVEYDAANGLVTLVNEHGQVFDLGLPLHDGMRQALENASEVTAIRMNNGRIARSQTIPLIVHTMLN